MGGYEAAAAADHAAAPGRAPVNTSRRSMSYRSTRYASTPSTCPLIRTLSQSRGAGVFELSL
jgi:hypothetical protein